MKALKTLPKGSAEGSGTFPCQGSGLALEPIQKSCPPAATKKTAYVRLRLPAQHAEQWLALPPGVREHAAAAVFGLGIDGVDLHELPAMMSELREARLTISNALQLALVRGATLDTQRVNDALDRINKILGGRKS